jgi:hypothetical protein
VGDGVAYFFIVIIAAIQFVGRTSSPRLQQEFAEQPPDPDAGQITLPAVPTGLADLARTTTARLLGGQASAPVTREGRNGAVSVRIDTLEQREEGLHLAGSVTNIATTPVEVSLDSFKFIDNSGTIYSSSGSPATTLQPQQQAPIDITLPIQNPSQLNLNVEQPDQPRIELLLIATPPTPD